MKNTAKKELSKGLLAISIVLVIIVVGIAYYFFFLSPVNETISVLENKNKEIEEQTDEYLKAAEMADTMTEYLNNKYNTSSKLASYSNVKKELKFLNSILNKYLSVNNEEDSYSITFSDPYVDEETLDYTGGQKDKNNGIYAAAVRRPLKISFTASDFTKTSKIISAIEKSEYRALFDDITLTDKSEQEVVGGTVAKDAQQSGSETANKHRTGFNDDKDECTVTINMEFIETLYGSDNIAGVEVPVQESKSTDESSSDDMDSDTDDYESSILNGVTSK